MAELTEDTDFDWRSIKWDDVRRLSDANVLPWEIAYVYGVPYELYTDFVQRCRMRKIDLARIDVDVSHLEYVKQYHEWLAWKKAVGNISRSGGRAKRSCGVWLWYNVGKKKIRKVTEDQLKVFFHHLRCGQPRKWACKMAGFSHEFLRQRMLKEPDFKEEVEKAELQPRLDAFETLNSMKNTDFNALKFYLTRDKIASQELAEEQEKKQVVSVEFKFSRDNLLEKHSDKFAVDADFEEIKPKQLEGNVDD